jgi:hypothetical protein
MPNWVYCNVTVEGPAEDMARFKAAARGAERFHPSERVDDWGAFTDIQLDALFQEAQAHSLTSNEVGFCFNALHPMPLAIQVLPYDPGTLAKSIASNEGIKAFCEQHGVSIAGYDWEHHNWGVKWGDCSTNIVEETDTRMDIYFETAWGPPHEFWEKVSADYPTLTITMDYTEEMSQFAGEAVFNNGVMELSEWDPDIEQDEDEDEGIVEGTPEE